MNTRFTNIETVPVRHIAVASFLMCSEEVRLVRTERKENNLVIFHFAPKDQAEKLVDSFWSDTATVSPRKVFSAEQSLKDLIFSGT